MANIGRTPVPKFRSANCLAGDAVGNVVYISGPPVSGVMQVAQADATVSGKRPSVGVIVSKEAATDCTIQSRDLTGDIFSGLTTSLSYFLGTGGTLIATPPSGHPSQLIGVAASTTALLLNVAQIEQESGGLGGGGGHTAWNEDEFTPTAGQVTFIISQAPTDSVSLEFFINGALADDIGDYTVSGTNVTWLEANYSMETTDLVTIRYQ